MTMAVPPEPRVWRPQRRESRGSPSREAYARKTRLGDHNLPIGLPAADFNYSEHAATDGQPPTCTGGLHRRHDEWASFQPRPGAMNSHGAYSWVMSVMTSISAGEFAASASRKAPCSP